MQEFAVILLSTIFVNNFVLVQCLGLCPFIDASNKLEGAISLAGATTFVLMATIMFSYLLNSWILIPLNIEYLKTIFFILVIAAAVQLTKIYIEKNNPLLHRSLLIFLPLIATNSAVLGVALQNTAKAHTFLESIFYGLGASIGFSLVLILFAAMRERLSVADVPEPFKGASIAMITAGLISLAFMGFSGIV
tara:strand:- start:620 stop:1195 length:576 start_codon:yes stop_codon:yes gene_type:complete